MRVIFLFYFATSKQQQKFTSMKNILIETINEKLTMQNLFEIICRLNNHYVFKATLSIDSLIKLKNDYKKINEFIKPCNNKSSKLLTETNKNIIDSIHIHIINRVGY